MDDDAKRRNRDRMREWREKNCERDRENQRRWRKKNLSKARKASREWRRTHPEKNREWTEKNRERRREIDRKSKARWWAGLTEAEKKAYNKRPYRLDSEWKEARSKVETDRVAKKTAARIERRLVRLSVCAVCGYVEPVGAVRHKKLHSDHCHVTNLSRSLLCFNHNTMLGKARENVRELEILLSYAKWCCALREAVSAGRELPVWEHADGSHLR